VTPHCRPRPGALATLAPALAALLAAGCASPWARRGPVQTLAAAKRAFDLKHYRRARRLASLVVTRHPTSPVVVDAWLVVIDSHIARRNWSRAYQECEKLLAAHPQTKYRTSVLQREFQIGQQMAKAHAWVLVFRVKRLEEGVKVLERVIEHAPFGPLAPKALYAIGEAYYHDGNYQAARDFYDRLLKQYPRCELVIRARVRRATCNQRLAEGPPYDLAPAEAARRDMEDLARLSGNRRVAEYARSLRDTMAQADYDSGLFYFRRFTIEGGVRYMKAVIARYPDSDYAHRARRILALVQRLTKAAQEEEGLQ